MSYIDDMSNAIDSALSLLLARRSELEAKRNELQRSIREIEAETSKIDTAVKALKTGRSDSGDVKSGVRSGSVKDQVLQLLQNSDGGTAAEIFSELSKRGSVADGRQSSVRTALWQLRKDGIVHTDANGRNQILQPTV